MVRLGPLIWLAPSRDQRVEDRAGVADVAEADVDLVGGRIAGQLRRLVLLRSDIRG